MSVPDQDSTQKKTTTRKARQPSQRKQAAEAKEKQSLHLATLPTLQADAAGIDIGARDIYVAVPSGRDPKPVRRYNPKAARDKLAAFLKKLRTIIVMDPACGSGNFLHVSLQMLLDLEKEVINFAVQLGFRFELEVSVQQLRAIEINPYAFELAQVSVQIGFLQWRRDNGFDNDRSPVRQNLDGFQNEDALLVPHFRSKAKTLKEAQAGEHAGDDALKFYTERDWSNCDVIVSNPPFLGGGKLWEELGRHYQQELWRVYENRVPGFADVCCYWFEKARDAIEKGKTKRVGLWRFELQPGAGPSAGEMVMIGR